MDRPLHGIGMAKEIMRLQRISKNYRRGAQQISALQEFSLSLHGGEVVGLLGPNGAGKTTVIKLLTSLLEADAGALYWRGAPIQNKAYLREIGVLLEGRGALNERLTTLENARYYCGLREATFDPHYFADLVALLEIEDVRAPVCLLSTGNKLKSALLVSVIHRPSVVIFDEPTTGLDLFGVASLERLVRFVAAQGSAVLVSSHDLQFVELLAERVVCICRGRKVFDGAKRAFLEVEYAYRLRLDTAAHQLPALPLPFAWRACPQGGVALELRDHAELCVVLSAIIGRLPAARALQVSPVTLQEKYLALVEQTEPQP